MNINNPTTFSTPNLTFSTSNSSGTAGALRADDTIQAYDATVPTTIAYSASAAAGSASVSARRDHTHGMPSGPAVATQAEMVAASSTAAFVTPGRTQYHPGVAKAWCRITAPGALVSGSVNVDSITDTGAGDRTIVWDVDFADTNYSMAGQNDGDLNGNINTCVLTHAVGSSHVKMRVGAVLSDVAHSQAAYGEQ